MYGSIPSVDSIYRQRYKLVESQTEKGYVQPAISHVVRQRVHEKLLERLRSQGSGYSRAAAFQEFEGS
jgi:hypothetical protein